MHDIATHICATTLPLLLLTSLSLSACDPGPTEESRAEEPAGGETTAENPGGEPSEAVPENSAPSPGPRATCVTDLDCAVCSIGPRCQCTVIATDTACGPSTGRCLADPCRASSASCWAGHCELRPVLAGPCTTDAECEVRVGDCSCDLYAALVSAPQAPGCPGQGCGARPNPAEYRSRCVAEASRCVLERAD